MEQKIVQILQEKNSISTKQLTQIMQVERHTLMKYLEKLKSLGQVIQTNKGMAKLWSLSPSPTLTILKQNKEINELLSHFEEEIIIVDNHNQIVWSNKQRTKNTCFEHIQKKEKCSYCPANKVFNQGKKLINKKITFIPIKDTENKTIAMMEIIKS